jgi:hypothetical protein
MSERYVGRFAVIDEAHRRVGDEARKTRVASFPGEHFPPMAQTPIQSG